MRGRQARKWRKIKSTMRDRLRMKGLLKMKGICILGSTGSIGVSTLDVVARHPDLYRVVALTANNNLDRLYEQCLRFHPPYVVLRGEAQAEELRARLSTAGLPRIQVLSGTK